MEEQTSQAPASSSPSATNQPASDPTSSSPVVSTSVAMTTSMLSTPGGIAGRDLDVSLLVNKPLTTNTVMSMSIVPTTGGQGESDANAGLIAGVVVGVVLAVVVVVVVAAIVLAVCSTQQRRKRSGQTCGVPVVALSVADDSGIALIRNPAYDELKNLTSSANETSSVHYDYACQNDIAPSVMGHDTSTHDAVLPTPMYEPMSDTPPAKVSTKAHSCAMTIQHNEYTAEMCIPQWCCPEPPFVFVIVSFTSETETVALSNSLHLHACVIFTTICVSS